jgi:ABC-type branched-subunit amino acid transport system ATPase component/predicted MFS family arabinose efflux permease
MTPDGPVEADEPAPARADTLAGTILELEDERRTADDRPEVADDALPGVGDENVTLRDALTVGGTFTFVTLASLVALDNLEAATLGTLSPDIRDSLGISSGTMVFISAASGAFLIFGAVPMGWLGDRFRRSRVIAWASVLFATSVFVSGLAINALMLVFSRLGAGITKSNTFSVQGPLLADQYPIAARGRIFAGMSVAGGVASTLSPLVVGTIAALAGGSSGWRWAFIILSVPAAVAAFLAFRLPDPPRGQYEKKDVLGEVFEDENPAPISMEAAFSRLMQINTLRTTIIAFAAMGFGLFTVPVLSNLFLEEEYDLGSFGRGAVATVGGVAVLCTLPFVGRYYDRLYRRDPSRALRLVGLVVLPAAAVAPIQYFMPNAVLFAIFSIPTAVLLAASFAMVGPVLNAVVPYRLRGLGTALGSIYIFLIGATGGALLAAILTNSFGPRVAVLVLFVPSTVIGGLLILRSSGFIKDDLAMIVAEIREEEEEHARRMADPDAVPAVQVNHIDFSYGQVQILFDVGFEVRTGEVLALLGTNGAGKSTILRVIAGLGTPARGVVRLHGRSITYVSPEQRTRLGVQMLPGGKGVFNDLTIRENLDIATFIYRGDQAEVERRIQHVLELFPELAERLDVAAGSLSGGQQQMVALAAVLTREPEILIIDELSLGLAPIVVERLVEIISRLKEQGMTIIIVEQSLNVAAAIAERAVFLEKGHVRFEGPMAVLMERNDLARAVFLGAEGG